MKKLLNVSGYFLGPLLVGLLISLFLQTAAGAEPTDSPNDFEPNTAKFDAVLVGDGITLPTVSGEFAVSGAIQVDGVLKTDSIEGLSGPIIRFSDGLEGPNFGTYYIKTTTCTSCDTVTFGGQAGMLHNNVSCDAGDTLINCVSLTGNMNKKSYGTSIFRTGPTWTCKGLANGTPISTTAICLSPNTTWQTTMN